MKPAKPLLICLSLVTVTFALLKAQPEDARPIASLIPSGALLYLEAKDFGALIKQWDSSVEKQKWLASPNFGVLSRSRLVQRLGQAQSEFADVAGLPVAYSIVDEVAGRRSAFAFYDLANLKFVYLTRVDGSRLENVELWRNRSRYESREASGVSFFVKSDPATNRTVALAAYKDWLVITTSEELMARTLALLASGTGAALSSETWFSEVTARASALGDLRLAYNLDLLLPTPQFRTYWLQQNNSELKQFKSGVADLFERQDGFEERRVLFRQDAGASASSSNLAEILRYAPESASLHRAWSFPDRSILAQQLTQVVLSETTPTAPDLGLLAPVVSTAVSDTGSASDFDTRIDQPPFQRQKNLAFSQLVEVVSRMKATALLHVQTTAELGDGIFVLPQSGVVIECEQPDKQAFEKALSAVAPITQTGTLDPLQVTVTGRDLIVTRLPLVRSDSAVSIPQSATYVAVFNKKYEWPKYKRFFSMLENRPSTEAAADGNPPTFFGGNIGSLGDTLARLDHVSVTDEDTNAELRETLQYQLSSRQ